MRGARTMTVTPSFAEVMNGIMAPTAPEPDHLIEALATALDQQAPVVWGWRPGDDKRAVVVAGLALLAACADVVLMEVR